MPNIVELSLKRIVQTHEYQKLQPKDYYACLIALLNWATPGKQRFINLLKNVEESTIDASLSSLNQWRNEAGLKKIKSAKDPLFQLEIQRWAQLRALHLAERMSKVKSAAVKKQWIKAALSSQENLKLSEKNSLFDECLDRIMGINERKLKFQLKNNPLPVSYQREDIYLELDPEDLFTPYRIILQILKKLSPSSNLKMVDLGCGMGRVGLVTSLFYPRVKFLGIELMEERYQQAAGAAKSLKLGKSLKFSCADLSCTSLPRANVYYLFNPFSPRTLKSVFQAIYALSENSPKKIRVVMAEVGRPPRRVKRETWLKQIYKSPLDKTWRAHGFSIYESR